MRDFLVSGSNFVVSRLIKFEGDVEGLDACGGAFEGEETCEGDDFTEGARVGDRGRTTDGERESRYSASSSSGPTSPRDSSTTKLSVGSQVMSAGSSNPLQCT
jgi:hypothetical protein